MKSIKKRNYKAEYHRRIANGMKRGLSRSEAGGHPTKKKDEIPEKEDDPRMMVVSSPCLGCARICAPATCRELDAWTLAQA